MASKTAQDTFGTFSQPGYITVGDPYKANKFKYSNQHGSLKGKPQMLTAKLKPKSAFQDGYFDKKFERVFAGSAANKGEAYDDPVKRRRSEAAKQKKLNVTTNPFRPSDGTKPLPSTGSYMNTFAGKTEALDPKFRDKKAYAKESRNFITNPGKKGSGYAYRGVSIGSEVTYGDKSGKGEDYDFRKKELAKERASHKAKMRGPAMRAAGPGSPYFTGNPYKRDRPLPKAKSKAAKKKVEVPFYPSRPGKSIKGGGRDHGHFNSYPEASKGQPLPKPKPKKFLGPVFRPNANVKQGVTKSVVKLGIARTVNASNYRSATGTFM